MKTNVQSAGQTGGLSKPFASGVASHLRTTAEIGQRHVDPHCNRRADISGKLREEVRELREKANAAELATTSILSNLNHEFRTPLNAVIGFSELLLSDATGRLENPIHRDYIEDIHESAFRLLDMVNDLLDTVNVSNASSDLDWEEAELIDLILQARDSVEPMAEARNINLELQADCAKCWVEVDRQRSYQAVRQVFAEAVRRAPPGGSILIGISTEGNTVKIEFSCLTYWQETLNTSPIPGAFNVVGASSAHSPGICAVDPDLSVARSILELHNGTLDVTDDKTNGLSAVIDLPKVRQDFSNG